MEIVIEKQDVGFRQRYRYRSLEAARESAQGYVGKTPEFGEGYAVGNYGQVLRPISGATLEGLFPEGWAVWRPSWPEQH
jgi:hypothetical protein